MTIIAIIFIVAMFVFGMWGEYKATRKLSSMAKEVEERHNGCD